MAPHPRLSRQTSSCASSDRQTVVSPVPDGDTTWIITNGVSGRLVTGKDDYANRSIFLPAAGYGNDSICDLDGSSGNYWSSTPISNKSGHVWCLGFKSGNFSKDSFKRYWWRPVRAVRGFSK